MYSIRSVPSGSLLLEVLGVVALGFVGVDHGDQYKSDKASYEGEPEASVGLTARVINDSTSNERPDEGGRFAESVVQREEDVHLGGRRDLSHHGLAIREPARSKHTDAGLIEPEFPHVMISYFGCPNADKTWEKD